MKTERLLAITLFLMNRKKTTARELADRFEVSVRTIQRDMESLALSGVPVYADRGKEGGYKIMENFSVNRHFFSARELASLTSLVGRLNTFFDHSNLKQAEDKLRTLSTPRTLENPHETLIMDLAPWGIDQTTKNIFQTVYKAIEARKLLHIAYASLKGENTERAIEPLSIVTKGSAWYVYAFCRLRSGMRLFKLTRIMAVSVKPVSFSPETHPPYAEDLKKTEEKRPGTLFVLKFAPSARGRITDYYNANSLQFMPDGSILGFFDFPEDEWVYSWILSFGSLAKVLEPPHAKEQIKKMVRELSEVYEKDGG